MDHKQETTTMKTGYIKLIHKRDQKYFLDNWRGLTLPNVDHKLLTKILATRLHSLFPDIIIEDQHAQFQTETTSKTFSKQET